MRQGTTPVYTLTVSGYDLTDKTVYVSVRARGQLITKTNDDLSMAYGDGATTIAFQLSQEETLSLQLGQAEVQVRFIDEHGTAKATDIKPITVERILQPGVITYEGGD